MEMPLKYGDLAILTIKGGGGRVGVPPKIGRLPVYGEELTGLYL